MTLVNGYPQLLASPLYPQTHLKGADPDLEREKRVEDTMSIPCLSLTKKHLSKQMYPLHDDTKKAMCGVLGRIDKLYKENFPDSLDKVNFTYDSYTFLDPEKDAEEIQRMFEKAETLYKAYREQCVNQALPGLPTYIHTKLNLKREDLPIVKKIIEIASQLLKEEAFYPEFDLFHRLCGLRVIHYHLRIPRYIPNSETAFVLRCLPFRKPGKKTQYGSSGHFPLLI